MRAVVYTEYGAADVLQLKEVGKPVPKPNEILVKIKATTVTVADVRARSFTVPHSVWLPARIALGIRGPRKTILGFELSGEVEEVGSAVTKFQPGEAIFAASQVRFGAYAEYICLPETGAVTHKPTTLSFEEAAAISIGARTALFFLRKAKIEQGQKVLVYGASGSVGSYAVQLAKHFGAHVTGVCSTTNVDMVKHLGADEVIDYTKEDFSSREGYYDVIFEAVDKSEFANCMKALTKKGTYINVTAPLPTGSMLKEKITGSRKIILSQNAPETAEALDYLKSLVEDGKLQIVIDRTYPLTEIVDAHHYVEQGHKKGNVVITID